MDKSIDKTQSDAFWIMKTFAVIAIVACHCTHVSDNPCKLNQLSGLFFDYWKGFGTLIFMFLAGFFYSRNTKSFLNTVQDKFVKIVLPWAFTGTIVWLYVVLRKGGVTFRNWFGYLFLKESYLHFLTELVILYLIFYLFIKIKAGIYVLDCVMLAELIAGFWGKSLFTAINVLNLNQSFIYCFILGTVFARHNLIGLFGKVFFSLLLLIGLWLDKRSFLSFNGQLRQTLVILFVVVGLYSACYFMAKCKNRFSELLIRIGRESFAIYLLHMPFAGIVANLLNRSEKLAFLTVLRPAIVIALTMLGIYVYKAVCSKILSKHEPFMERLIGLR